MKCSACGERYAAEDVSVIGRYGDVLFFSVYCPLCQREDLVAAEVRETAGSSAATIDPGQEEIYVLSDMDAVDADDVVNMHCFLKGFDGDFARLFHEGKGCEGSGPRL